MLNMYDKVARPLERRFKNKIYKLLMEQLKEIIAATNRVLNDTKDNGISKEEAKKKAEEVIKHFKIDEGIQTFMLALLPEWINAGKIGAKLFEQIQSINSGGKLFAIIKDEYLEWLNTYGGDQIKLINQTTKELTREIIEKGLINGDSTSKIIDRLSSKITDYSKNRAKNIAETEIHNTIMKANAISGEKSGFKYKTWISSRDSAVRVSHRSLDGEVRRIDEPFSNGGMYPGDSSLPAKEVCHCRCIVKYQMSEKD
ncbi:phage minor head protein [Clostridium botulinum]|uniref:phage minor head protein n=1 Tax=Clostridium botulinum TaxID=1491 RepID=UPI0009B36EF2|nr:phage minor head protein [Clostridium botulinum]